MKKSHKRHKKNSKQKKKLTKKDISHILLTISGFTLLLFFLFNLSLEGFVEHIPFDQEIVLVLVTILSLSYLFERSLRIKQGGLFENFYSFYLAWIIVALAILYWISVINNIDIDIFRTLIVLTHIIVFLYSLITINHAEKLWFVIISYIFTALLTIILFAYLYWTLSIFGIGHLQFNDCSTINPALQSENWFYFSSVTFYSLGYGDICPVTQMMRIVSQLEVALGAIINTVLIGFIFWRIRKVDP